MNLPTRLVCGVSVFLLGAFCVRAEVKTMVDHNTGADANRRFKFQRVAAPSTTDAATAATFTLVDGEADEPSAELSVLHDGKASTRQDQPDANFFFAAGGNGGRLRIDLNEVRSVEQVNTYSWHPDTRGPQIYKLYAADGKASGFNAEPKRGIDPTTAGWKWVASVDTRPKDGELGGQYGVSTTDSAGPLGSYRYLLFDISPTESDDPFGNTFYTEIDVVAAGDKDRLAADKPGGKELIARKPADDAKAPADAGGPINYNITIDTSETPELKEWADTKLRPVVDEWYPKIVAMLPSEGYTAPRSFSITFRKNKGGVADTSGTRVNCAADWFMKNLDGEGRGAVVHEMVHVVQQYRPIRGGPRNPGWLVEGIADYIRWFIYEPQSKRPHPSAAHAKYDDSYRTTATFLDYVANKYDKDLPIKLNTAMRRGRYSEDLWTQSTGKSVEDLGAEWKESLQKR